MSDDMNLHYCSSVSDRCPSVSDSTTSHVDANDSGFSEICHEDGVWASSRSARDSLSTDAICRTVSIQCSSTPGRHSPKFSDQIYQSTDADKGQVYRPKYTIWSPLDQTRPKVKIRLEEAASPQHFTMGSLSEGSKYNKYEDKPDKSAPFLSRLNDVSSDIVSHPTKTCFETSVLNDSECVETQNAESKGTLKQSILNELHEIVQPLHQIRAPVKIEIFDNISSNASACTYSEGRALNLIKEKAGNGIQDISLSQQGPHTVTNIQPKHEKSQSAPPAVLDNRNYATCSFINTGRMAYTFTPYPLAMPQDSPRSLVTLLPNTVGPLSSNITTTSSNCTSGQYFVGNRFYTSLSCDILPGSVPTQLSPVASFAGYLKSPSVSPDITTETIDLPSALNTNLMTSTRDHNISPSMHITAGRVSRSVSTLNTLSTSVKDTVSLDIARKHTITASTGCYSNKIDGSSKVVGSSLTSSNSFLRTKYPCIPKIDSEIRNWENGNTKVGENNDKVEYVPSQYSDVSDVDSNSDAFTSSESSCDESAKIGQTALTYSVRKSRNLKRKSQNPKKSPEKRDPRFKGVTIWLQTEFKNGNSQLHLSAFYSNVKIGVPKPRIKVGRTPVSVSRDSQSCSEAEGYSPPKPAREVYGTAKTCASCRTRRTPLWRDAEDGTPLCNACGIRYKKYRLRCSRCWFIPKKDIKTYPNCPACGSALRYSFHRKTW